MGDFSMRHIDTPQLAHLQLKHKVALNALYEVDAEVEKFGWDQPNRLMMVSAHELVETSGSSYMFRVSEVALHPEHARSNPSTALTEIREFVRTSPLRHSLPQTFYGWLLVAETWAAADYRGVDDRLAQLHQQRRLHLLPERIEARMLILATASGGMGLLRQRNNVVHECSTYPLNPGQPQLAPAGEVWDALREFTHQTLEGTNRAHPRR